MERNTGLDFLKVLACFAVVVLHVTSALPITCSGYSLKDTLYYIASFAVPTFFMVNGYLLLSREELGYPYIVRKILRILGVVFAWNVIVFLEKLLFEHRTTNLLDATYTSLLQGGYFWQFWYFGTLLLIYLILPPIHRAFRRVKPALVMTGSLVAVCLAVDLTSILCSAGGLTIVQMHVRQTFRLWTWLAYFLLGGLLGKKEVRDLVLARFHAAVNWAALVGSAVVISFYQYSMSRVYSQDRAEFFYDSLFTFVYVTSLFLLLIRRRFDRRGAAAIAFVSRNVMGIYIVHVTVIAALIPVMYRLAAYHPITPTADVLMTLAVFTVSLAVSALLGRLPLAGRLIRL